MSQTITVASGKGGTGKSTFTIGLAKALSALDKKVAVIDSCSGLRCLDIMLGVDDKVLYTYADIEKGNCTLEDAMVDCDGFSLISPPQSTDYDIPDEDFLINFCKDLQNSFDFIIIDSYSGISGEFRRAIAPADKVILVTEPTDESVRCVDHTAGVAEEMGKEDLLLVINKVNPDYIKKGKQTAISTVIDMLGISTLGIVPDGGLKGKKYSTTVAYEHIARRLTGEKVPLMTL